MRAAIREFCTERRSKVKQIRNKSAEQPSKKVNPLDSDQEEDAMGK